MTCRLKTRICDLIDPSKYAFQHGRSILDSVATAHEIISVYTKYNWSVFFLKLDFVKIFDTINWACLLKMLHAQGFGDRWCGYTLSFFALVFPQL